MQPPENHVAMMQIDCEVINTRLLHIHQDSIPAHVGAQSVRPESNNASLQRNESQEGNQHQHHFDHASASSGGARRPSMYYSQEKNRYAKPTYIEEQIPRVTASMPPQHQNRKHWKHRQRAP